MATIWESHKEYLRRMLISLSRDVDLADDLVQETYLRARDGISTYRGGDARAWLAAIARNTFHSYARHRYVRSEIPLDECANSQPANEPDHLVLIELRRAIADLSPGLRAALMMKHYGGFTYSEIGKYQGCPEGTARRRVWTAIRKLRKSLSRMREEMAEVKCTEVKRSRLLDYIYGALREKQAGDLEEHLKECSKCREDAKELRKLIGTLDSVEGDYKLTEIIDLDESGIAMRYGWWSMVNGFGRTMETNWWTINKDHCVDFVMVQGQEVKLELMPLSDEQYWYETLLPQPAKPGEAIESVMVLHSTSPEERAQRLEGDMWRYFFGHTPNSDKEWILVLAIRLPVGARFVTAQPEPTELKTDGTTTIIWRALLPKITPAPPPGWDSKWQFECTVGYEFKPPATLKSPEEKEPWDSPCIVRAPDVVFKVFDMPWSGVGDQALEMFREVQGADLPYMGTWFKLGYMLYEGKHYNEALEAFDKVMRINGPSFYSKKVHPLYVFAAIVWQGHILDILDRREEALQRYQESLTVYPGGSFDISPCGFAIDEQWVKGRLKTPFERK